MKEAVSQINFRPRWRLTAACVIARPRQRGRCTTAGISSDVCPGNPADPIYGGLTTVRGSAGGTAVSKMKPSFGISCSRTIRCWTFQRSRALPQKGAVSPTRPRMAPFPDLAPGRGVAKRASPKPSYISLQRGPTGGFCLGGYLRLSLRATSGSTTQARRKPSVRSTP